MMRPVYEVLVPLMLAAAEEGKIIKCYAVVNTTEREIKLVGRGKKRKPIDRSKVSELALYALENMVRMNVSGCLDHLSPLQQVPASNYWQVIASNDGQLSAGNYSSNSGAPWSFV